MYLHLQGRVSVNMRVRACVRVWLEVDRRKEGKLQKFTEGREHTVEVKDGYGNSKPGKWMKMISSGWENIITYRCSRSISNGLTT